jgi:chloramphenicol-sensitive protein RarD
MTGHPGPTTGKPRRGVPYGLAGYGLWGVFPLYFHLLRRSGAVEVVVHRVLWSLLVCLTIVAVRREWGQVRAALRDRRHRTLLAAAALVLSLNWGIYVFAVESGHVVEASLGYFVNPLVTVLLGVSVLHERLQRTQWVAVAVAAAGVVVLTVAAGRPPWIALSLALSFGSYGLIKNRVGAATGALAGLTTETVILAPPAAVLLVWLELTGRGHFTADSPRQGLLLAGTAVVTAVPLLLFAAAARRVPLSTLGLMQYLTPVMQLLCGVLLLGESMSGGRWLGFGLVWLALLLLTVQSLRASRDRGRPAGPRTAGPPAAARRPVPPARQRRARTSDRAPG